MKNSVNLLICNSLRGLVPVLPLRGLDSFSSRGGDLDYLVPKGFSVVAARKVAENAIQNGFWLVGFRDIGYISQIILVRPSASGVDDTLKVDFFNGISWYGVGKDWVGGKVFEGISDGSFDREKMVGVVTFIQKLITNGSLNQRDWLRIVEHNIDGKYVFSLLNDLGINISLKQIETLKLKEIEKWRLRAATCGADSFEKKIIWFFKILYAHFKFKLGLKNRFGSVVGISGMDGCGKSTLFDRFIRLFDVSRDLDLKIIHLLPEFLPTPHKIFKRKRTINNYEKPYFEPPVKSNISGIFRLLYYFLLFTGSKLYINSLKSCGKLVVMDRNFLDFIADLNRAKIPNYPIHPGIIKILFPRGEMFYLNASPENVTLRKNEIPYEKALVLRDKYIQNCKMLNVEILNADAPSFDVFTEFLNRLHEKILCKIV